MGSPRIARGVNDNMMDWLSEWSLTITLCSLLMFVVGLGLAGWMIVIIPQDYFVHRPSKPNQRPVALHALWVVLRNVIGIVLIAAGIAMLFLPGQGLISILLGVAIADLPGKQKLMTWMLTAKSTRRTLNWIRRKADRAPLRFPEPMS